MVAPFIISSSLKNKHPNGCFLIRMKGEFMKANILSREYEILFEASAENEEHFRGDVK